MRFLVPRKSSSISLLNALNITPGYCVSLRKLNSLYAGPAIRVSRSNDSNQQDIYFNAFGNLDTLALLSFCGSNSASVVTWYDQSGNNRNFLSNGSPPLIVNNGSLITQSGKPSINFANQCLICPSTTLTAKTVNGFCVTDTVKNYATFTRQERNSGAEWAFRVQDGKYVFYSYAQTLYQLTGSSNVNSIKILTVVTNTNNAADYYESGSQTATVSGFDTSSSTGPIGIGGNGAGGDLINNGYISELFVFETSLSDAQRTILEASQLAYYINNTSSATGPTASTGNNATAATAATSVTGPTSGSGSNATGATYVTTVNPVFADGAATRYDLKASNSSMAVNSPTNIDIIPNGNWNGQTLNLALTKGSGSFPATLTAPSSGNNVVSFNYTPTVAGEHSIRVVSNLYAPLTHPINAYNSDNGTPSAISAISLVRGDQAPHQYNVLGKKPNGFENITCVGWSRVPFNITLTKATNAVYIKLIDALSFGANANLNTGTYLNTTPIQVYGPLAAGSYTINLLLPASLYYYFAEFASDSAFTNPIRVASRFTCGLVVGINQRSMECAIARNYSYGTATIPQASISGTLLTVYKLNDNGDNGIFVGCSIYYNGYHAIITSFGTGTGNTGTYNLSASLPNFGSSASPVSVKIDPALNQTYDRGVAQVTYDSRYAPNSGWYRHDGYTPGLDANYGEGSSAATMRFAELVGHYLGVTVGFTGASIAGGGVDSHINHDGTPVSGFTATIAQVDSEYRLGWFNNIGWDATDPNYPTELATEVYNRISSNCDYTMKTNPSVALIGLGYSNQGWNTQDGSRQPANGGTGGEFRFYRTLLLKNLASAHIFDKTSSGLINGNAPNSHAGQGARTGYAEVSFRKFYYAEVAAFGGLQTKQTGPLLNTTGTIVRGSNQIKVGFTHHGGTSLLGLAVSYDPNNPVRNFQTASGAELASIFTVYNGANSSSGSTVIMVSSVSIDNTNNQFIINLVPGQTFQDQTTLQFNCDYGISNNTLQPSNPYRAAFIADNNTDTSIGLTYGNLMIPQLDVAITTV